MGLFENFNTSDKYLLSTYSMPGSVQESKEVRDRVMRPFRG